MRTRILLLAVLAALLGASANASAQPTELMPGVTYDRQVRVIDGRQVVLHVVTAPKPGGLYDLAPTVADGRITGLETVTGMQQALAGGATAVGVNGDLYNFDIGTPSGILMQDGVLLSRPFAGRSSLAFGLDGLLRIARAGFFGNWSVGTARGSLGQLNRPLGAKGVGLFTPAWGEATPLAKSAVDIVLEPFPPATAGTLSAPVAQVLSGGGTPIPADGAILQATGPVGATLAAAALPGTTATIRIQLKPWWPDIAEAIGGGPTLVQDGRVVSSHGEAFSSSQLDVRAPRTAAGQLPDGRIVFVAVDGRSSVSAGLTSGQLAQEMGRLGAVTAMAFDSGGSTALAFDGELLNAPSDGSERRVSDALMVLYYGVYAPRPSAPVVSPNGDAVAEGEDLAFKVVRPSTVDARLVGPGGHVFYRDEGQKEPGTYPYAVDPTFLKEGKWRWVVSAVDADGNQSKSERAFTVNNTLGFLELSKRALKVTKKRGATLGISFKVAERARVTVAVADAAGRVVRTLSRATRKPGAVELAWDARDGNGKVVAAGAYTVSVTAVNALGSVELDAGVVVRRR